MYFQNNNSIVKLNSTSLRKNMEFTITKISMEFTWENYLAKNVLQ